MYPRQNPGENQAVGIFMSKLYEATYVPFRWLKTHYNDV